MHALSPNAVTRNLFPRVFSPVPSFVSVSVPFLPFSTFFARLEAAHQGIWSTDVSCYAARLVFSSWRYAHVSSLLGQLHSLKARQRIDFKLALLIYECQHGAAASYLADELSQPADLMARRTSSTFRLISVADYPPYAAVNYRRPSSSCLRCSLAYRTVCRSVSRLHDHCLSVFRSRLKTHLFRLIASSIVTVVPEKCHCHCRTQ